MKFKTPKTKDVTTILKGGAAFELGKRAGRGVVALVPAQYAQHGTMIKGGLAVVALFGAAAYQGSNKDLVIPGMVGLAFEQIGDIIDGEAKKMITKKPAPTAVDKFIEGAAGLGCPCDQPHDQMPPIAWEQFPMLGSPVIREIEWNSVWNGEPEQNAGFAGA